MWQDQTIFFNLALTAIKYDFESEEGFTFCAADTKDSGRECPPFNTLSTEKLKEVVASAKTTFKWQSSKEGEALQEGPFKDWMFQRPLALRPIYWEISIVAYTNFKMGYEEKMKTEILGVRRYHTVDLFARGDRGALSQIQHSPPREWDEIFRKCLTQDENRGRLPILAGL